MLTVETCCIKRVGNNGESVSYLNNKEHRGVIR